MSRIRTSAIGSPPPSLYGARQALGSRSWAPRCLGSATSLGGPRLCQGQTVLGRGVEQVEVVGIEGDPDRLPGLEDLGWRSLDLDHVASYLEVVDIAVAQRLDGVNRRREHPQLCL